MRKRLLLLSFILVTPVFLFRYFYKNTYVTYEIDTANRCNGNETTLAPRNVERVVVRKYNEKEFLEESIKNQKCVKKVDN